MQRIAIARYMGARWFIKPAQNNREEITTSYQFLSMDETGCSRIIPDYLNDLNAMNEVEKSLVDYGERAMYLNNIYGIMGRNEKGRMFDESIGSPIDVVPFASAVQRAEAFLRTMNLWKN